MPEPLVILDFESFPASAAEQIRLEAASVPVDEAPAKGSRSTAAPRALMPILSSGNPETQGMGKAGGSTRGSPGDHRITES